ncbi:MAG TPA: hypothetical protein DC060_07605 [Gemmatimonadetes bacterium]|jgi:hypothetical protein|nr:hypothetical protein [Gemmatimonadota bacterium]HAC07084.1 hypothetical protein [Gemmatimonadota bacterium]HBD98049.1 hypothetical protein [Gemmatimonadota bacterium]HIC54478.1 hypothetical protein [Gemmatimonadota bacterium]HIN49691.1 hypothetical protein [Gemmatimonadota bacterium]
MSEGASSFVERMVGATFLSVDTFEEVEHDENATGQAAMVVAIVAVARGVGAWGEGPMTASFAAVGALGHWAIWAGICYLVGVNFFGGKATWGELLRTLGFAQSPGVLWIFAFIPILGWPLYALLPLWVAVAGFIAIRQALDIGNTKTVLTILVALGVSGFLELFF